MIQLLQDTISRERKRQFFSLKEHLEGQGIIYSDIFFHIDKKIFKF